MLNSRRLLFEAGYDVYMCTIHDHVLIEEEYVRVPILFKELESSKAEKVRRDFRFIYDNIIDDRRRIECERDLEDYNGFMIDDLVFSDDRGSLDDFILEKKLRTYYSKKNRAIVVENYDLSLFILTDIEFASAVKLESVFIFKVVSGTR